MTIYSQYDGKNESHVPKHQPVIIFGGFEVSEIYSAWYKATFQGPVIFSSLNPAMAPQRPFFKHGDSHPAMQKIYPVRLLMWFPIYPVNYQKMVVLTCFNLPFVDDVPWEIIGVFWGFPCSQSTSRHPIAFKMMPATITKRRAISEKAKPGKMSRTLPADTRDPTMYGYTYLLWDQYL